MYAYVHSRTDKQLTQVCGKIYIMYNNNILVNTFKEGFATFSHGV